MTADWACAVEQVTTKLRRTLRLIQNTIWIRVKYVETCFDRCHKPAAIENVTIKGTCLPHEELGDPGWKHTLCGKPYTRRTLSLHLVKTDRLILRQGRSSMASFASAL